MSERSYDLVVLGGGAGGLSAARWANWSGKRAVLINAGPPGGDCTFTGCVPSKAVIEAAERGESFKDALAGAAEAVSRIAATENGDVLRGEGIDVIDGRGTFVEPTVVEVDGNLFSGDAVVVATGARAAVPPIPGLSEIDYLTNHNVFDLREAPGSMAVLGGGSIGCELAQAFAKLGVKVTLFEAAERLLAREEPDASEIIAQELSNSGVGVRLGASVTEVFPVGGDGGAELLASDGHRAHFDKVLVAVGRQPNTSDMGFERAGIDLDERGYISHDGGLNTSAEGVFVVGDAAGSLQLTHAAVEMGRIAALNALTRRPDRSFDTAAIPWATFTSPEVARVGLTEAEAAASVPGARVAELPMTECDRAITAGKTAGFVKLIAAPKKLTRNLGGGRLVGATIVAERAGEMIHEASLAMHTNMFVGRLGESVHAYPTWSMAVPRAVGQFFVEIDGRTARPAER